MNKCIRNYFMRTRQMLSNFFEQKNKPKIDLSVNNKSTEFEINKWETSEFIIDKILPITGFSPYPLDELMLMVGSLCRFKPTHIFEWGTHIGKSARIFYETINYFDIESTIHSFDLPDEIDHVEHPHEQRGKLVKGLNKVHLYQEDGLIKSFDIFRESSVANKRAFFYLDGDHSYETVHHELTTILSKMPDAIVLLHDTFYQSEDSQYNIGPFKAIDVVLAGSTILYKRVETKMGLPGMTLIYKSQNP